MNDTISVLVPPIFKHLYASHNADGRPSKELIVRVQGKSVSYEVRADGVLDGTYLNWNAAVQHYNRLP